MLYTGKYVIISFNKSVDYYHTTSCINSYRFFCMDYALFCLHRISHRVMPKSPTKCVCYWYPPALLCVCVFVCAREGNERHKETINNDATTTTTDHNRGECNNIEGEP